MDLAKHLVLELNEVVPVEEIAVLEQRMAHALRARVEHAVAPQGTLLVGLFWFGEASFRKAIRDFVLHYHEEKNHQGKSNQLLFPRPVLSNAPPHGEIRCEQRLGGLLKYYHREAA